MAINLQNVERFKFIAHKIIPLVYDDSLSYYEFLCKVMQKLNDVISSLDNQNEILKAFDEEILDWETSTDNKYNQFVSNINTQFEAFKQGEVAARTAFMDALIESYNASTHYAVGQYVRYDNNVYKCTTATSGEAWNPAHWTQVVYADDLSERQSNYEKNITAKQNEFESYIQAQWDKFFDQYLQTLGVVQTTGTSTTDVMSQKAVTDEINALKGDLVKFANPKDYKMTGKVIYITDAIIDNILSIDIPSGAKFYGKNIFDQSTYKYRKIINDAGAEVDDYTSGYFEQYIPVSEMGIKSNFKIQRCYQYDSNKNFLGRTNYVSANTLTYFDNNVAFIRIQIDISDKTDTMCVVYGDNNTEYIDFYSSSTQMPYNQSISVWSDGSSDCSITLKLINFISYVPKVSDYPVYEPAEVTSEYSCTPLGQNTQSIPLLSDTLKYKGFIDTYYNIYLGTREDGYSVTREDLGLDSGAKANGNYACPIYSYEFKPKAYNKTVLLSAGMNTCEASTYFGLAYFVKELMTHSDLGMEALYNSTRFIIIPVICPSGILHNPLLYENSNGVKINNNFEYGDSWKRFNYQNRGEYPDSEVETIMLKKWLNKYRFADFWLDCHSDTASGTERLTLGGGFCSNSELTTKMTLNKTPIFKFYRSKGYYTSSQTPDMDYTTLSIDNTPYPKMLYAYDVCGIPSIMFEQYVYSKAYGSDGKTNNDSYGIKHYATMIRHMCLVMCKDTEKWNFN